MRILLPAIAITIVLFSAMGVSSAQTVGPARQIIGVYAQVVVHDSSGNLVAYLETSRVTIMDPARFNQLLDQNMDEFTSSTINVNGQNIEILKANDTVTHTYPTIVSQNLISVKTGTGTEPLVAANHDGYAVLKGDKVTTYWTIIRTAS